MIEDRHNDWFSENQRFLKAALGVIRAVLDRRLESGSAPVRDDSALAAIDRARENMNGVPALENLAAIFELTSFERMVLLMCAGVELDPSFADSFASINNNTNRRYPTFGMALDLFADGHWTSLTPGAPLRYHRLIELTGGNTLIEQGLRIDERILHYLMGVQHLDQRLEGYFRPVTASGLLPPSHRELACGMIRVWSNWKPGSAGFPIIHLNGHDLESMRLIARTACEELQLIPYEISDRHIPTDPRECQSLIRLWQREAALGSYALVIPCLGNFGADAGRNAVVRELIDSIGMPVIVAGELPETNHMHTSIVLDVEVPGSDERNELWKHYLGDTVTELDGNLDILVHQFRLDTSTIRSVAQEALAQYPSEGADDRKENGGLPHAITASCRRRTRAGLTRLAQRIDARAIWKDIVLPPPPLGLLREIAIQVRQRMKVYEHWGFARKFSRGLGISALFAGPSGTGKTMAAEVLANELDMDLFRIDLSQVVSKYIGETEKNLRLVFDAAESGAAILLFDEADALFGKRSEVKDSHDRYANIEISYLLQRMEAYHGLAILTTNMKSALDEAFLRRIRFIIEFPFPDAQARHEIWRRVFPNETPVKDLDMNLLAQLNIAGGNIFNIAMHAAFRAAEENQPVNMNHMLEAARTEYCKLKKPLSQREIRGWA